MRARGLNSSTWVLGAAAFCTAVTHADSRHNAPAKAAAPIPMSAAAEWCLKRGTTTVVAFRGLEDSNPPSAGPGTILYPAPSAIVLLAAIATHAAIGAGVRSKQESDRALAANRVLDPYRPVLDNFKSQELLDRALAARARDGATSLACGDQESADVWTIDSAPAYAITQDQLTIVLDNLITMHPPGAAKATGYRHVIRVVSTPVEAKNVVATWTAEDGTKLKNESVALFGQSLEIAMRLAAGEPVPGGAPFKTYRYLEGGSERMERAQFVHGTCDRMLLKTLRGSFLSVPTLPMDCEPSTPAPVQAQEPMNSPQQEPPLLAPRVASGER